MSDARMEAARAIVRIKTSVRKENPTSTQVHVDSVMGAPRPRAKKRKKPIYTDETMDKAEGGLGKWFDEKWVDISRPKEGGGYEECGRSDASEGKYPKCVPQSKANSMTAGEKKSAVRRKRQAESTETREGKKPINVATFAKAENIPTDKELYARVKAEAKKKFDVYPSAYANAWLVQEYKRRGGKYRVGKASFSSRSEAGRYAAEQRWKDHVKTNQDEKTGSGVVGQSLGGEKPQQYDENGELTEDWLKYKIEERKAKLAELKDEWWAVDDRKVLRAQIKLSRERLRELQDKKKLEKASPAWQREEGKNPKGGLNAKGRASYKRETGGTLRPPVKSGDNPRRASFLARMGNAKGPERNPDGSPTRLLLSLQAWGANSKAEARKKAKAISARNKNKETS